MAVETLHFSSTNLAIEALENELYRAFQPPRNAQGPLDAAQRRVVIVAGGSSPQRAYDHLSVAPPLANNSLTVVLSDERYVERTHRDANYRSLLPLAHALKLPPERFVTVDTSQPIEEATSRFGSALLTACAKDAHLPLAVLGIGSDGHIAGLFSPEEVPLLTDPTLTGTGRVGALSPFVAAHETGEHHGHLRISVSASLILSFARLILFAPGKAKHDVVERVTREPNLYPAGRIIIQHPSAKIWTSEA